MKASFELRVNTDRPNYWVRQSELLVRTALLNLPKSLTFHNLHHAQYVVRAAEIIGRASHLRSDQLEAVVIAAWFHDIGYSGGSKGHEERSASTAAKMLTQRGAGSELISDVTQAILATELPQRPVNIVDMVLCDADQHYYFTDYGNNILGRRKQANINRMLRRIHALRQPQFILNH